MKARILIVDVEGDNAAIGAALAVAVNGLRQSLAGDGDVPAAAPRQLEAAPPPQPKPAVKQRVQARRAAAPAAADANGSFKCGDCGRAMDEGKDRRSSCPDCHTKNWINA